MTSRCRGPRSGPRLSVGASQETGVVRAMVLTRRTTRRSGIPPASSILASLGCKVLQAARFAFMCFHSRSIAGAGTLAVCMVGPVVRHQCWASGAMPARVSACVECVPFSEVRDADHMRPGFWAWIISIVLPEGMYLAAERSEDGASGRYTAPSGGATSQNHCSNHSGFLTGADT